MPKISYLVSTYDSASYLDRCIRDLLTQTLQDFEIIIINPNSPDNDDRVAQRWQDNDVRVRYRFCPKREPYGQSWMRAWKMADGIFVCNANTDDKRHMSFGATMYNDLMQAHLQGKKVAFAYPGINVVDEVGRWITGGEREPYSKEVFKKECHAGPPVMWRSDLLKEIDWDIAWNRAGILTSAFDYWLWMKFISLGYDGLAVRGRLVEYTQRSGSIEHKAGVASTWQTLCAIAEFFPESIKEIGKDREDALDFVDFPHVPKCEEWCDAKDHGRKWYGTKFKLFLTEKDLCNGNDEEEEI